MLVSITVLGTLAERFPERSPGGSRVSYPSTLVTAYCLWPIVSFANAVTIAAVLT